MFAMVFLRKIYARSFASSGGRAHLFSAIAAKYNLRPLLRFTRAKGALIRLSPLHTI